MYESENIGWNFPICEEAPLTGADGADAASVFRDAPIKAITKEVLQNSIDAMIDGNGGPVVVEFSMFSLPSSQLPGRDYLKDAIKRAERFAVPDGNSQKESFYARANEYISMEYIPFLRISDFGTTGLTGSTADAKNPIEKKNSKWLHLVRGMGMSNKSNGDGGSHGKGKSAAIANSALSTLFYSTYAQDEQFAFAGVSYLSTFLDDEQHFHLGTGCFCVKDGKCTPILRDFTLDPCYRRTAYGTDIYIAGFQNHHNWEKRVLVSVLDEFLLAVHLGKVEVHLPSYIIDRKNLSDLLKEYTKVRAELNLDEKEHYADICWQAIVSPVLPAEAETIDFGDGITGTLSLYLTMNGKATRIDEIRQKGMRVQAYHGRRAVPITGCLYIHGDKINQFLAGLEDEAHSEWQIERAGSENTKEYKQAQRVMKKLKAFIAGKLDRLFETSRSKRLEAEGVEEYFPLDLDDGATGASVVQSETPAIAQVTIRPYKPSKRVQEIELLERGEGTEIYPQDSRADEQEEGADKVVVPGPAPIPGPGPGPNPPGPNPDPLVHETTGAGHLVPDRAHRSPSPKAIKLQRSRIIGGGVDGEYTVAIQVDQDCSAIIELTLSGEETQEKAVVARAMTADKQELATKAGVIGPVELKGGQLEKIRIVLAERIRCSLEVKVSAY